MKGLTEACSGGSVLNYAPTGDCPIPARRRECPICSPRNQRWAHPGQQQGRRFPSLRLEHPHSIRRLRVSAFLADSIQHIHSLRASGVISSHAVNAFGSDVSAFFKSAGTRCTTPLEILFCDINELPFRTLQRRENLSKGWGVRTWRGPATQVNSTPKNRLRQCDAQTGS